MGLSKRSWETFKQTAIRGNINYRAPEAEENTLCETTDVWSLGVMILDMIHPMVLWWDYAFGGYKDEE